MALRVTFRDNIHEKLMFSLLNWVIKDIYMKLEDSYVHPKKERTESHFLNENKINILYLLFMYNKKIP
jgi:hypothetical protein